MKMRPAKKEPKKVITLPALEREIAIPAKEVEALLNAVGGCQWNAVGGIVQNIRELAQDQLPEVFPG